MAIRPKTRGQAARVHSDFAIRLTMPTPHHFWEQALEMGSDSGEQSNGSSTAAAAFGKSEPDYCLSPSSWLRDRHVGFAGRLGGIGKREARHWVQESGGRVVPLSDQRIDTIVLGADSFPFNIQQLDDAILEQIEQESILLLEETEFWQRCGHLDRADSLSQLYTPAMLADLLDVPVRQIRRWHRLGLIHPVKEVHRLPYYDFQEVASARRLVRWVGRESPERIERRLAKLASRIPGIRRPLSQLPIIVEGQQVLLRQMSGLVEANGQCRFDFDSLEESEDDLQELPLTLPVALPQTDSEALDLPVFRFPQENDEQEPLTPEVLLQQAIELEDNLQWGPAIEVYRSMIMAFGPTGELCFQIAELLYRQGDLSGARERYYMAIELDDELVEARANLGCVLADLQQWDLAIAAFEGALEIHPDYADVLFHLASALEKQDRGEEAVEYWSRFLQVAPNSPWAPYARSRFSEIRQWSVTSEPVLGE